MRRHLMYGVLTSGTHGAIGRWRPIRSGVVGNPTLVAAVAGGAVALLLVVGIVLVVRNRRAARATDPAPGLRTPLVGE